jgi:cytochrome c biogenesis protein CcdA
MHFFENYFLGLRIWTTFLVLTVLVLFGSSILQKWRSLQRRGIVVLLLTAATLFHLGICWFSFMQLTEIQDTIWMDANAAFQEQEARVAGRDYVTLVAAGFCALYCVHAVLLFRIARDPM